MLKIENKELQELTSNLQTQMRSMVQCPSNSSQSFPMFNELTNMVSEFQKCDCQDVFFDILSSELNLEGVVYFFQNTMPQVVEQIEKHFWPVEFAIREATGCQRLDLSVSNVLRKKYQSNWRQIYQQVITPQFCEELMQKVQSVLAIADNENEAINSQIVQFLNKLGEVALQMMISDPPLLFDFQKIGQKVNFNQYKQESLDGFIKTGEECLVILPPVHKLIPAQSQFQGLSDNQGSNGY